MTGLRIGLGGDPVDVDVLALDDDGTRGSDVRFDEALTAVVPSCIVHGTKLVVRTATGDPGAVATALRSAVAGLGIDAVIAHVEGHDLLPRYAEVRPFLGAVPSSPSSARADLGAWGIVEALDRGADVVVAGRVTPASLVVGPAAWHHGWSRQDWDEIAGAVVAGQILTGGTGSTGANYAFFDQVPAGRPGPPVVEVRADGSAVVTKRAGTGGLVATGTVIAQLLESGRGLEHADPDATVRRNSVRVEQDGPDRVVVHSVRGLPGPEAAAVELEAPGGHRTTITFLLTGVDLDAQADRVQDALWAEVPGGIDGYASVEVNLRSIDEVGAELRVTAMGPDGDRLRAPLVKAAQLAADACPGARVVVGTEPAAAFPVTWWAMVPTDQLEHVAVVAGEHVDIAPAPTKPPALQRRTPSTPVREVSARKVAPSVSTHPETISTLLEDLNRRRLTAGAADDDSVHWDSLPMAHVPLGRVAGARSGLSGPDATVGVWVANEDAYDWLQWYLSIDRFQGLLPAELEGLELERFELPNLNALSFVVVDLVPRGPEASARLDPTARSLGEHVRAQVVDVPDELLGRAHH